MDIHEQNLAYEESLLQDREREFQEQLKMIEELSLKEAEAEANKRAQLKETDTDELLDECDKDDKKPTKEELRILRMKFYIGNNNGKNTK